MEEYHMTSKSKQVIMAAVGAYLVYTGVSLVRETIAGEPKNQILFILAGVFFAIFGLATIVHNIRIIVKATKAEIQATEAETEENSDTDAEESEETEKESVTGKTMRMKKSLVKRRYQKKLIHQMKNRRKKNRKCELEWDMMFIN